MGASYCVGGAEGWEERNKEAKKGRMVPGQTRPTGPSGVVGDG
jgi:hypothetical protein